MNTVEMPATDDATAANDAALLSNFGPNAGKHGCMAETRVACLVRVSRAANLRAERLSRGLGLRKSTWISQLVEVASEADQSSWYRAIAAYQNAARAGRRSVLAATD